MPIEHWEITRVIGLHLAVSFGNSFQAIFVKWSMEKYRLYIDESGTHDYSEKETIKHRYLGLIGVIVALTDYQSDIQPKIFELKRMFSEDPDELVLLHRDEIVNRQGPFVKLYDLGFESKFNESLLDLLDTGNYILCGIVLDKKSHYERYGKAATHPYHYCLNVLLERYVLFLEEKQLRGDVVSEARGKREDGALRDAYSRFYLKGTNFISPERIQDRLTSQDIKLRTKKNCAEGLELADLLVLATKFYALKTYNIISELTDNFGLMVIDKIHKKFRHNGAGGVKGYGIKLIM